MGDRHRKKELWAGKQRPILLQGHLKQLHSGLEHEKPPFPPRGHSARALALAFLSHRPPGQGVPARHPLLGVVVELVPKGS